MTQLRLHATIFTLFPEMFPGTLGTAIHGRALANKIWDYNIVNLRDFSNRHDGRVDDRPYGGGAGMVIRPDVIDDALNHHLPPETSESTSPTIIYFSASGAQFTAKMAQEYAQNCTKSGHLYLIAGRYEGIDQRVIEKWQMREICIGPYVLSGGELPVQIFLDAVLRFVPDVLGNPLSLDEESFSENFSGEYPHYTRPQTWQGREVPETLVNGNHQKIIDWRKENSKR